MMTSHTQKPSNFQTTQTLRHWFVALACAVALLAGTAPSIAAQTSAFTYQGRLNDGADAHYVLDRLATLRLCVKGFFLRSIPFSAYLTRQIF